MALHYGLPRCVELKVNARTALLEEIVDYAGLFPPASLPLAEAARNYAAYREGKDREALGAFVIPAHRVEELLDSGLVGGSAWPLSLLWTRPGTADLQVTRALAENEPRVRVQGIETKASTVDELPELAAVSSERGGSSRAEGMESGIPLYLEFSWKENPRPWVEAIGRLGLRAKIRTGGIKAALIPSVDVVAEFLCACVDAQLPFKATAGLHHPLRGEYPLTYEADAAQAMMHGYLNVFLAGLLYTERKIDREEMETLLAELDPAAFHLTGEEAGWKQYRVSAAAVTAYRRRGMQSFGSCSFTEPLEGLYHLEMP